MEITPTAAAGLASMAAPSVDERDLQRDLAPVLDALAEAPSTMTATPGANSLQALKSRLMARAGRALAASAGFITHRGQRALMALETTPAPGVRLRRLHSAEGDVASLRAGEPWLSVLVQLAPGCSWHCQLAPANSHCEWLTVAGQLDVDGCTLQALDFVRQRGGPTTLTTGVGAHAYLRVTPAASWPAADPNGFDAMPSVQRNTPEQWEPFAPRIQRRLLHTDGRQAAMLYLTEPLAQVPHHGHGHDEECLMLQGELFLDDILLGPGDFQLAPAGSAHHEVFTDTGCLLYAHGDLELGLR